MTVSSTTRKTILNGNGVATSFPFAFKVFAKTDLTIIKTSTLGIESTLVLDTNYSITLNADQNANPGGTVIYPISGTALATGEKLTILSNVSALQETDLLSGGGFYPQTIEDALDRTNILNLESKELRARTITVPASDAAANLELPTAAIRANKVMFFDANGNINLVAILQAYVAAVAENIGYTPSGTGAIASNVRSKLRMIIDPMDFGAVGDGIIDDTAALQLAVNYAGSVGNYVTLHLQGKTYAVSSPINFNGLSSFALSHGKLKAIGTWADNTSPIFNVKHTGTYGAAQAITFEDLFIDCQQKCGGIYFENFFRCSVRDSYIVGFPSYGIKTINSQETGILNGDLQLERVRCEQYQINVATPGAYTGIGFHIRCADFVMHRCKGAANATVAKFESFINGQVSACHFFNGTTSNAAAVSNCANNGSGKVRVTATGHGYSTNQRVKVASVVGTTEANGDWIITVIDANNFDLNDSAFVNAYVSGGTLSLPRPIVEVLSTAHHILFSGCYFDSTDVILWSFDHVFTGSMFVVSDCELVLVSTNASEAGDGLVLTGCLFGRSVVLATSGAGTWQASKYISAVGNSRISGSLGSGIGRIALARGTVSLPSLVFGDTSLNDYDTGLFSPAADTVAVATAGAQRATVDSNGRTILNYTAAIGSGPSLNPAFQIHGNATLVGGFSTIRWTNDAVGSNISIGKSRGASIGTNSAVQNADGIGKVLFVGDSGSDLNVTGASVSAVATGLWTGTNSRAELRLGTTPSGATAQTERLVVGDTGNTYPYADNAYSCGTSSNRWSVIYAATGTINTSDEREKTNIADSGLGLDFVNALRPISYTWKVGHVEHETRVKKQAVFSDKGDLIEEAEVEDVFTPVPGVRQHYGLLAQDVKKALGDTDFAGWVLDDPSDPNSKQGLRYDQFIPILIRAVQELNNKITKLGPILQR